MPDVHRLGLAAGLVAEALLHASSGALPADPRAHLQEAPSA